MAFEKHIWTARDVQYPGRIILIATGNTNEWDVIRSEGTVNAEGDILSAELFNSLEERIKAGFDEAGSAYIVKDHYDMLSDLQTAHPTGEAGDAYFIGTTTPYDIYQWGVDQSAWINAGQISGPAGQSASIEVGTVTTGSAGSSATVTNSGTESGAIFNFTIPQGAKGDQGEKGDTGDQGPAGQDGSSYTVLGHYDTLLLLQAAHPTGNPGDAYFVGATTPYDIYQWNVDLGEWENVGQFQGPKGDKGDKGDPGDTGAQGEQGETGPAGPGVPAGGTPGQLLNKSSSTDYATEWSTLTLDNVPDGSTRILHNITISTSDASGGSDGDIWFKVAT